MITGIQTIKDFGEFSSNIIKTATKDIKKPDSANEIPLTDEEKEVMEIADEWVNKILKTDNEEYEEKIRRQQENNINFKKKNS